MDVTSATLISVQLRLESKSVELDSSCVIHPFYVHKMDSGPVRLMTIAHATGWITGRSTVGRSSRTVKKSGKMFLDGCEYFMGTTGGGDVSNRFDFDGRGT